MTWDQIQKQLDRSRSASEKSREAKEQLEALTTQQEQLSDREARLEKFDLSNQHDRELVALDLQYRHVSEQINSATGSVPKALLDRQQELVDRFHVVNNEKQELLEQLKVEIPKELTSYVSSMSKSTQNAIASDPELLALAKDAKQWRERQGKVAKARPKLQAKKAGRKGSAGAVAPVDGQKASASAKVKRGDYTNVDPDAFLDSYISAQYKS